MSILLDALRKSEQSQRRGAVPTLETELPPSAPPRRLPLWLPWVLLAAVLVAALGWWLLYGRDARLPGDQGARPDMAAPAGARPADVAVPATAASSVPVPAAANADEDEAGALANTPPPSETRAVVPATQGVPQPVSPQAHDAPGGPAIESASDTARAGDAPRTPVETPVAPLVTPGDESARPSLTAVRRPSEAVPGPAAIEAPEPVAERRSVPDPDAAMNDDAPAESPAGPFEAEPVSVWALPDSVRARLPEFRISVLVYSARPEDRFALVNGRRLGEGDALSPGLELVEVRRDGAVFTFERYRFLVSR